MKKIYFECSTLNPEYLQLILTQSRHPTGPHRQPRAALETGSCHVEAPGLELTQVPINMWDYYLIVYLQ